jgi:XRE family transcriptional regulator, aerobic/anaerobic benzoate catabolism transcriptional regulator
MMTASYSATGQTTGVLLRAARAKAGMTRKQLAQASATSERYLALLESGNGNPSLSVLGSLATALGFPLVDLLTCGGEETPEQASIMATVRRLPASALPLLEAWLAERSQALPDARAKRILLIGLRGAGKSTLGHRLAASLGIPFVEMSRLVEDGYGGDIGLLIELSGQAALHRHEAAAWDRICDDYPSAVIAAPGAIVADAALYDRMLATAHSLWLQASPDDHMARVMAQGDFRPMASNRSAMKDLEAILRARSPDYARAQARIDTSQGAIEQVFDLLHDRAAQLIG